MNGNGNSITATQWTISGISILLVLMLLGFIFHRATIENDFPPIISVHQERVVAANQAFVVEFTAKNTGGSTAKSLEIEGVLTSGGKELEKSAVTIDFVPSHAERRAGLIFSHDPRQYQLDIRPKGFDRP